MKLMTDIKIMKTTSILLLILALSLVSCNSEISVPEPDPDKNTVGNFIDDWTFEVFLESGSSSIFSLWIPDGITPKALLVLSRGGGTSGLDMVHLKEWQDYALQENLALLGTYTRASSEDGSRNLNIALANFAKERNIDQLEDLPILLRGFSSGGRFSHDYASIYPNKTLAFADIMGPVQELDAELPPGLFILGGNDNASRNELIKNAFLKQRNLNGLACLSIDRLGYHDTGDNDELVRVFFSAMLEKSLDGLTITKLNIEEMNLGSNSFKETYSFDEYPYDKVEASCLINEAFKTKWLEFEQR